MSRPAPEPWRSHAFGLQIEGSFPAPGLPPAASPGTLPRTRLDVVPVEEIDADWPAGEATRVMEEHFGGARPARTIDRHPEAGYRLYARHFGLARLSPDGAHVRCAPPDVAPWRWQRFLVGRVLPWAAVLRGHEAFHAGAVELDGRAVAIVGPTGAGKTSLVLRLVLDGAGFLTDDVLALDGELRAHAGAGIVSVRPAERARLSPAESRRLGRTLGHSGKTYFEVARVDAPVPLAAVYFLAAGTEADDAIAPFAAGARTLLASTFVLGVQSPERLRNQLDVCARLARDVPAYRAHVGPDRDAAQLAAAIRAHAAGALA